MMAHHEFLSCPRSVPPQVKGGGAIPNRGTKYTLETTSREDFRRDVLKSDTAVLEVPELELVLEMGTLGSMYTTVEGLLNKVSFSKDELFSCQTFSACVNVLHSRIFASYSCLMS